MPRNCTNYEKNNLKNIFKPRNILIFSCYVCIWQTLPQREIIKEVECNGEKWILVDMIIFASPSEPFQTYLYPFASLKRWTCIFSLQYVYIDKQTGYENWETISWCELSQHRPRFSGLALVKLCKTSMEETWSEYWGSLRTGLNVTRNFSFVEKKPILERAECSAIFLENLAWNFREGHHVNCRTG